MRESSGRRVAKARDLLTANGRFPDFHGAFCLLRSCTGWAKVQHSCRTVLPDLQPSRLRSADYNIRAAQSRLIGSLVSHGDQRSASLGIASGGTGARSAAEHAHTSQVLVLAATLVRLWPAFDPLDLDDVAAAEASLQRLSLPLLASTPNSTPRLRHSAMRDVVWRLLNLRGSPRFREPLPPSTPSSLLPDWPPLPGSLGRGIMGLFFAALLIYILGGPFGR